MKKIVSMIVVSVMAMSLCAVQAKRISPRLLAEALYSRVKNPRNSSVPTVRQSRKQKVWKSQQLVLLLTVQAVMWKFRPGSKALSV